MEETKKRKLSPKMLVGIIIGAVLLIGGSVAAYIFSNLSDKQQYFLAEKETMEFMNDQIEKRYEAELDWFETSKEKPTETNYDLSAESNLPSSDMGMGEMDPVQLINNSTISLTHAADMKNKKMSGELKADIGGMQVEDVSFHLTSEQFMLGLPFLDHLLSIKGENVGNLMKQIDPMTFTGEEKIDFGSLFEGAFSEEDIEYIKEEYGTLIYEQLPDEAFKTEKESIKVHDESLKTEKITMQLSEKQVKDIVKKVIGKLQKDDKMKKLIRKYIEDQSMGTSALPEVKNEIDQLMEDLDESLANAKTNVDKLQAPDGLTSTIWVHDDLIAQRDFNLKLGPDKEQLTTFKIKGTQLLTEEKQQFNLDLGLADSVNEGKMNLTGDLSWKDQKADDSIKLTMDDFALTYDGTETLKDGKRDFERTISFQDPYTDSMQVVWSGTSDYKKDQMSGEHSFAFTAPNEDQSLFSLNVAMDGKTIDKVKIPNEDKTKDIGTMNEQELMEYFETEVTPKFEGWIVEMLSATGNMEF
ncbi:MULTISPECIES: DUF6583 family protein [Clostridia]|uniref:DUF6583 family protein n=1 Tax=Clostridia TaxID=186801 RepID=UPI000EA151CA|nr:MULTISPECIES: DUF6583 family protein [Clostridia]NBJ68960.1 hypothetical protein [Roseburia sp. 1XD42-34]RKI79863.1 hypothetical protein D7V87_05655 [Clostridium sp. 1xD42-85]